MIRTLRRTWNRMLGSFFRRNSDGDLAAELELHISLLAEENIRRGMPPDEAWRRARLEFGSLESAKESYRDQRGLPVLDAVFQDVRYALRGIHRSPGFAAVAILSLAIGIGANTAIFSVVNTVLLRPLGYKDPQRIFVVREVLPHLAGITSIPVNPVHVIEWARRCQSIERAALIQGTRVQTAAGGEPASILGARVGQDLFALLGIQPILGRTFLPEEEKEGNERVVILTEPLWRARFGAEPSLVGKSILLNGQKYQVAGIVPAFRLPYSGGLEESVANARFEFFVPLVLGRDEVGRLMGNFNYGAVARLKAGATAEEALAELNVVEAQFPRRAGENVELRATLIPVHEAVIGRARLGLWMLAVAIAAVLLIVCVNLANLLLSRMTSRARESAIRAALGASRARQLSHVLAESLLLSVAGTAIGLLLAHWTLRILVTATTLDIPRIEQVRLDTPVLVFTLFLTLVTALLFGSLPAWRLARTDPQDALRAGSHMATGTRGGVRLREVLIGLEVGLSAALLIVAGLLTASLMRLLHVDKGFDVHRVLTVDLRLPESSYSDSARNRFFDRVLAKVDSLPGVQSSGLVTQLPTRGETWLDPIYLEGDTRSGIERPVVNNRYTSPGYFQTMNVIIRQGRAFEESDRSRGGVAVLSAKAANLLWPGEPNPLGRQFMGEDNKRQTLVGIAAEVRANLNSDPPPTAYYPYWQRVPDTVTLVVRTSGDPRSAAGALRAALRGEDARLPIPPIETMEQVVDNSVAQRRFQLNVVVVFAISALLVASLGIYGVVSYSVVRRRNEIGIRMALGARPSELRALVVRQGMAPVVLGLAAGVGAALALARMIRGLLFGVQPADPTTIVAVAMTLLFVGLVACLIPAHRAAATDPIAALRFE